MIERNIIQDFIARALQEDLQNAGDITSLATIEENKQAKAILVARQSGVVAGLHIAEQVFKTVDASLKIEMHAQDGDYVEKGFALAHIAGTARSILTAERTALNFVGRLSGIATLTNKFAKEIAHTKAKITDTRKTTPTLRVLEKYAVKSGGGVNHRMGLYDAILIKDNHIAVCGGVKAALEKVKNIDTSQLQFVEIEVDKLDQLKEALEAGAKRILLDNMSLELLREAVRITNGRAILEASGGVTLQTVKAIAETGVDLISSGALTHSAPNFDVALDIEI